jgi:hypothetical protein
VIGLLAKVDATLVRGEREKVYLNNDSGIVRSSDRSFSTWGDDASAENEKD